MTRGGDEADRRQHSERRERSAPNERRGRKSGTSPLAYVLRAIAAIVVLLGVILYAVSYTRPIYATRGTLGEELARRAGPILPVDSSQVDRIMATPKFQQEKQNFYEDVMRLKQVDSARADSIARFAVREAYLRGISPALIFGVMLTENARFISKATSSVGAVGLMQVYPKVWLTKEMTSLFGRDLVSDSTNVKYGVFILSHYFNPKTKTGETRERDWQTALLRYNGCLRGTNTPRCHTYPNKVQSFVENQAKSICDGRSFYDCIAKPFIEGLINAGKPVDPATPRYAPTTAQLAPAPPLVTPPPAALPATVSPLATPVSGAAAEKAAAMKLAAKKLAAKKLAAKKLAAKKLAAKKLAAKKRVVSKPPPKARTTIATPRRPTSD